MRTIFLNIIKFLFILLVVCFQFNGIGQQLDLQFISPIKDKNFASKNVTCFAQDSTGYIWIGTDDGLHSFNGYQLTNYYYNNSDSLSLVNNNIKQLLVDKKGDLWISTIYGVCVYDKTFDNFKRLSHEFNYAGLESLQISSMNQDASGEIYVSAGRSIYKYNTKSDYFKVVFQLEEGYIIRFVFDNDNNLWVAASNNGGLIYYDISENRTEYFLHEINNSNSIGSNTINDLAIQDNRLWIGTYGTGVNSLDLESGKIKRYPSSDSYAAYTMNTYVDKENNFWSIDLTGIKLYDKQNDSFWGYYGEDENEFSLNGAVSCIFQDIQGNYWIGYKPGGVHLRFVPKGFEKYNKNPNKYWHTSDNNITAIEFDSNGNYWIGNGFNGIDIFNWQRGEVVSYHYDSSDKFSLGQGGVACIFRDSKNKMWVGTNFGGLQYYSPENEHFYSFVHDPNDSNSIANNDVRSIIEDKDGDIWIVPHGKGIDRFDQKKGVFYHYTFEHNNLANNWAFQVLMDANENLWVATSWGASRLLKGEEKFENYLNFPNDSNTISSNGIICLFEDSKKQIWLGTTSGLNKYRPETNDFQRYHSGLFSGNINAIQEDNSGNLWISTMEGISRFNPETKEILDFDETDGLLGGTYNRRSVAKHWDDPMFFGGSQGLTYFDPNQLVFNKKEPKVKISGFKLFNTSVKKYGKGSVLEKHISETKEIVLNYDQNILSFEFATDNLINAEKNKFQYKLEGVDKNWISADGNSASYIQLQPGKYTFRVIASNNDNVWNYEGASLKIVINPPWWQTWWFYLLVLSLLIFALVFFIRHRMAKLIRQKERLEEMVLERTNILKEKNILLEKRQLTIENQSEELRQQAEELQVTAENIEENNVHLTQINATKDKLFSIVAHDLLNPFNVILGFTETLIENFETWGDQQKLEVLNYIRESSDNAFNLLENLLHWSRAQKGKIEFNPEPVVAKAVIKAVLDEVSSFALKKQVEIVNLFQDDVFNLYADKNMLKLICRNLLMNAIKFSNPSGKVIIDMLPDYNHSFIRFSVSDMGVGMEKNKAENLFNFEKNSSTHGTNGEKGVGLGLVLCLDFVKAHKGEIWVESQMNKGTTVFFTLPKSIAEK